MAKPDMTPQERAGCPGGMTKQIIVSSLLGGLSLLLICLLGAAPAWAKPYEPPTAPTRTPEIAALPEWLVPQVMAYTRFVYRADPEIDPAIVLAVISVESMGNEFMVGSSGERGPMQVIPTSWTGTPEQLSDELYNIRTGVNLLEANIGDHGLRAGLAFYNCGPRSLEGRCGDDYAALVMNQAPVFRAALSEYEPPAHLWDAGGLRTWLEEWGY